MKVPLSPLEFARRARKLYAGREAVVDGDLRLSYAQFFERCDRWAGALRELGVARGDRVACIAPNTHALLESFYAVPGIGAVLVPINYRLAAPEMAYIINHSGARVVCAHPDYLELLDRVRDELPAVEHFVAFGAAGEGWRDYEALLHAAEPAPPTGEIDEDEVITINYTSGTTSTPKGVRLTHRNVWVNCAAALAHVHVTPADRYLWTLPMFHVNGWGYVWTMTACGGTHVCLPRVDPAEIFRLLREEGVTLFCAAPTVLIGIASAPPEVRGEVPRGLRVLTAGAPPAAATIERIEQEFGWELIHVYGMTEASPFITICEPRPEHAGLPADERAALKARQGVETITSGDVRVVDEEGAPVPWDGRTQGEIVARGNVIMKGYYNDPEATGQALAGGWYHTGDSAVVHADGYIEIRDRIKDVIISGGENISSVEVEGVLLRHEAVQEVAVVGLPHEKWGETPHAFVVLRQGARVTEQELIGFLRERMAHFKVPRGVTFVSGLPKTATG
ncbi:MAG: long-chain-fatty-acid--CoA ligase, partial [Acidobacteriota bacterium]|nr:long-chain-fatty-acid--CoA ligase [Acidobacteriota bacterium]